jgi:hypothetical protein
MDSLCFRIQSMNKFELINGDEIVLTLDYYHFVGIDSFTDHVEVLIIQVIEVDTGDCCAKLHHVRKYSSII